MNNNITERVKEIADYIIKTKSTIREAAKKYNISKSTVHKDLKERLYYIDFNSYKQIEEIFKEHIEIRHIKGGQSTKKKYFNLKQKA